MNNEIKEILKELKQHTWLEYEEMDKLLDYITNLQEKVDQYENPDDLTLFYMWLDEKAKDKIKQLQEENKRLKIDNKRLQHNEKVFKSRNEKAIEYIGNGNIGIPRKTRDKFIAILEGENYNKVERAYLDDEWIGEDKDVKD